MKIIKKGSNSNNDITKLLTSNNIVKIHYELFTRTKRYLVFDYLPYGKLVDHLIPKRGLDEQRVKFYVNEIMNGMFYVLIKNIATIHMHNKELYFWGFTPDDVYITGEGGLKMSNIFIEDLNDDEKFARNPFFWPSERIRSKKNISLCDYYSLGVFIMQMVNLDVR